MWIRITSYCSASQLILLGDTEIALAGGVEVMSSGTHVVKGFVGEIEWEIVKFLI